MMYSYLSAPAPPKAPRNVAPRTCFSRTIPNRALPKSVHFRIENGGQKFLEVNVKLIVKMLLVPVVVIVTRTRNSIAALKTIGRLRSRETMIVWFDGSDADK